MASDLARQLERNQARRAKRERDLEAAREELRALLARGRAEGIDVTTLARHAGISRETAHKILRRNT